MRQTAALSLEAAFEHEGLRKGMAMPNQKYEKVELKEQPMSQVSYGNPQLSDVNRGVFQIMLTTAEGDAALYAD